MKQVQEREDECVVCHKVDLVKNLLAHNDYDSICKECSIQQNKHWEEFEDRMARLEPILKILRGTMYSKEDLKQLQESIKSGVYEY